MTGQQIWDFVSVFRDTILTWAYRFVTFITTPLDVNDTLFENLLLNPALGRLLDALGNPSVLELMFNFVSIVVVIILVKWVVDVFK